ncbi:MAG: hypothetical protein KF760_19615 [Candidatus Eremiobacteraeota bacterium]|nr:hypothetical protein [Candidatus Eremiobacteraeota bacterium]MCW5868780.1 hypothetical protein [Candidatus Eremiobacteraeota bacterium]
MILYRLRNTREGRKRDEFASGEIHYQNGSVHLDVPDRSLAKSVQKHFLESFRVRAVRGSLETFLGHAWIDLLPGSEQHFDEGLRQLVRLNLIAEE